MKLSMKVASTLAVLALGLVPATGVAAGPNYAPEHPDHPAHPATPKGKAYGFYCKGQSKEHVEGVPGTDFSKCVKSLARAGRNESLDPKKACKALSRKHVKGEKGTAFSRCVQGVNRMRRENAS